MQKIQLSPINKVGNIIGTIHPTNRFDSPYRQEQFDLEMCLNFLPIPQIAIAPKDLPDPKIWSSQLAIGIAEVLIGDRPAFQLIRWLAFDVYCSVERRAIKPEPAGRRIRPLLRAVQVTHISNSVVNVSAVIQKGVRGRAMAMKLVAESDRWRCTELLVA